MSFAEILEYPLLTIGNIQVNVATLVVVVLIVVGAFWVSTLAQRGTDRFLRLRGVDDFGSRSAAKRLVHYTIIAVGLGVAFHTLGLNLTTLFAAGAFLAIALGFAMQNITQNFVSGIILLAERTIKPDDVLEVEGTMVKVTHMGIRGTVARTLNDEDLIIPNAVLVQSTVKNYTLRDPYLRLRCEVGVSYGSDMAQVRRVLEEMAAGLEWKSETRAPVVLLTGFGDSSVVWEVSVWIENPFRARAGRSQLNEAIWNALKAAGITIAFPQMDVHLDPEVVQSLGVGASPRSGA